MKQFRIHWSHCGGRHGSMVWGCESMDVIVSMIGNSACTGGFLIIEDGARAIAARAVTEIEEVE